MLIGELVQRSGVSKDTIRFYEKRGLIELGKTDRRENNYKEYSEQVLERIMLIRKLKDMGFTLGELSMFIELWHEENASCQTLKYTLEDKITFIDSQIQKLNRLKFILSTSLDNCNSNNCEFEKAAACC